MAKSPKTFTSHSPPRVRTLSGPATRRRWTRELLQTRNRAFGPNGVPTTSRQTSATRKDTTSRLPISLGSTNKTYEPSTHLRPAAIVRHRAAAAAIWLRRLNLNIQRADYRGANLNVRAQEGPHGSVGRPTALDCAVERAKTCCVGRGRLGGSADTASAIAHADPRSSAPGPS